MAALGLALGVAGIVTYFVIVVRFGTVLPQVRSHATVNWLMIVAGLALSLAAMSRAAAGRRRVPAVLLAVNVLVSAWFGVFLYVGTAVPTGHPPAVGAPAPDFAVVDHTSKPVRLADYRGNPRLLVFYRGHW